MKPITENIANIKLTAPIARGDTTIETLALRTPKVGDLRGLQLNMVLTGEGGAVSDLINRISVPTLEKHEINTLDVRDFVTITAEVVSFLAGQPSPTA